ncbi:MAG: DUF1015 family protein, partial [Nitriliruptorales bacterium]
MVDVAPFRAVRYRTHDLADLTAPPYDAIDADLARALRDRNPHNVVRLELGEAVADDRAGADRYSRAADLYRRWEADGVLARDAEPGVDVYEQRFDGRMQRGLLVAVGLVAWGAGSGILPHEHVFRGPIEDRLRLLRALPVNLSPIYLLGRGEPSPVAGMLDDVTAGEPAVSFTDREEGVDHRLWRVTDPSALEAVSAAYADETLLVADGHHRYTTALEHRESSQAPDAGRILAYVAAPGPAGDGPIVRPMHRVLPVLPGEPLGVLCDAGATVEALGADAAEPDEADRLLDRLDEVPEPAFVLSTPDGVWVVAWPDVAAGAALVPDDVHPAVRELEMSVVDAAIARLLGSGDTPADPRPLPTHVA